MKKIIMILVALSLLFSCVQIPVLAADDGREIEGVQNSPLAGGTFDLIETIQFRNLFEPDGSTGTNGTIKVNGTQGLKAEQTESSLKFLPNSTVDVKRQRVKLLDKSYSISNLDKNLQYYMELPLKASIGGELTVSFEDQQGKAAFQITKAPDQSSFWEIKAGDQSIGTMAYSGTADIGVLLHPEAGLFAVYTGGQPVLEQPAAFQDGVGPITAVRFIWHSSAKYWSLGATDYLELSALTLYQEREKELSDADRVRLDRDALSIQTEAVTENLNFPSSGANGSEILWESDRPEIIDKSGTVNRPETDTQVTLTATIKYNDEKDTKIFVVTVMGTRIVMELEGIENNPCFPGGSFTLKEQVDFADLFKEGEANGLVSSEQAPLIVEKTSNGIYFRQNPQTSGAGGTRGKAIMDIGYDLPELPDAVNPYYIEVSLEQVAGGALEITFGSGDGVVKVRKRDAYTGTDGVSSPEGPEGLDYKTGGITRESAQEYKQGNTKIGIYVIPALRQMVFYYNGKKLSDNVYAFPDDKAGLDSIRFIWYGSIRWWAVTASERLLLQNLKVFEGEPLPGEVTATLDLDALNEKSFTQQPLTQITQDLNLPPAGTFGNKIAWRSSDPKIIDPVSGKVTRPSVSTEVTLTATIETEGKPLAKTFTLMVLTSPTEGNLLNNKSVDMNTMSIKPLKQLTDENYLSYIEAMDKNAMPQIIVDLETSTILSKLILFAGKTRDIANEEVYSIRSAKLEVSNDRENWIEAAQTGSVEARAEVRFIPVKCRYIRLIVTEKAEGAAVKLYEMEAVLDAADDEMVKAELRDLKPFPDYVVEKSAVLPTTGVFGTKISWTSSKLDVISATGTVSRPAQGADVSLTAIITFGNASGSGEFTYHVPGTGSGSGGNTGSSGGGGRGGGVASGGLVSVVQDSEQNGENPEKPQTLRFVDVPKEHWAYSFIESLADAGVVQGDEQGLFRPDAPVLREEFVKMILEAFAFEARQEEASGFSDVTAEDWFAPYIGTAEKLGLIHGISDGIFGVGLEISRQDMAVIALRAAEMKELTLPRENAAELADLEQVSDYAQESVEKLNAAGIITGDENHLFHPEQYATRAQTAKIICKLRELFVQ